MIYLQNEKALQFCTKNTAVALGKFDGIHIGHQRLIQELQRYGQQGYETIVFSFSVNPQYFLEGNRKKIIYTSVEKALYFEEYKIDYLLEYPFTKEFANLNPQMFVEQFLVKQLGVKQIFIGEDFCFGKNRSGNVETLKQLGKEYGFEVHAIPKETCDGQVVSSSLIREQLSKDFSFANKLLGNPYFVYGEVIHGNHLGNTIEFPTINQRISENKLVPAYGVYASQVLIDGKPYKGISNLGVKPTVGMGEQLGLETHILDFSGDLYGKKLKTQLLFFIREEQKFDGLESLKTQIQKDIIASRENT